MWLLDLVIFRWGEKLIDHDSSGNDANMRCTSSCVQPSLHPDTWPYDKQHHMQGSGEKTPDKGHQVPVST